MKMPFPLIEMAWVILSYVVALAYPLANRPFNFTQATSILGS